MPGNVTIFHEERLENGRILTRELAARLISGLVYFSRIPALVDPDSLEDFQIRKSPLSLSLLETIVRIRISLSRNHRVPPPSGGGGDLNERSNLSNKRPVDPIKSVPS